MSVVELATSNHVAHITLDRPPLNVIDLAAAAELSSAIERTRRHSDLRAVVLTAAGKAFCAGVDVRDHLPDRGAEMIHEFHRACLGLLAMDVPVVAAVQGAALGGGCELTLCCDIVVAAHGARFGVPEIKLGVFPPVAAVGLARVIGAHRASELVLTGRTIDAVEAERIGLANRVVPDSELSAAVDAYVNDFIALSGSGLRAAKRALQIGRPRVTPEEITAAEALYLDDLLHDANAIEGLRAFMEKRAPKWGKG